MSDDNTINGVDDGIISLNFGDTNAVWIPSKIEKQAIKSEAITIRNLGPIKDITIDDIKPFTVFIGESAGGKSVIMRTITLFRWFFKQQNLHTYLLTSKIPQSSPWGDVLDNFEYAGLIDFVGTETEIQYTVTFDNESQPPFQLEFKSKKLETSGSIPIGGISYCKLSYITETRGFLSHILNSKGSRPAFEPHFEEVVEDFEKARAKQNVFDIDFLQVRFSAEKADFGWKHHVSGLGDLLYRINFHNSASSIQNTVPMLLLASYFTHDFNLTDAFNQALLKMVMKSGKLTDFRPVANTDILPKHVFLHIEEPELGLFPDAQCSLINSLIAFSMCETCNPIRLMLTTHSPYILNHLNLLIKAHDTKNTEFTDGASLNYDDIAAYYVTDGGIEDLKRIVNQRLIDTDTLSDTLNDIYDRYEELEA
jgi:hypothetical protein